MKRLVTMGSAIFAIVFGICFSIVLLIGLIYGQPVRDLIEIGATVGLYVSWIPAAIIVAVFKISDLLGHKLDGLAAIREARHFKLRSDIETAYRVCIDSLKGLDRAVEIIEHDKETGEISVRTAMTWRSFGEYIRFKLTMEAASLIDVQVMSRPVIPATTNDYGINARNIAAVARTLGQYDPPEERSSNRGLAHRARLTACRVQ